MRGENGDTSLERFHPRPLPPEPQLIPIPMRDGDDEQPPQEKRQRERSRSRDRVPPHAQVTQVPQIQPMVTPELDDVSHEDFAAVNPSSPSAEGGPRVQKGKKTVAEQQPSELPKAKTHKFMDSDEDDEEPQNETGISSNSHPSVPVLPLHPGSAANSPGLA